LLGKELVSGKRKRVQAGIRGQGTPDSEKENAREHRSNEGRPSFTYHQTDLSGTKPVKTS